MRSLSRHVPRSAPRHACALTRPLQLMLAMLLIACMCAAPILASAPDRHSDDRASRTIAGDAASSDDGSASTRSMPAHTRDESRGRADTADDDDPVTDYDYYDGYAEYGESDEVDWEDDEHAYDSDDDDTASVGLGSGDAGDVGGDEGLVIGWAVGHGCHSCKCLPPCKSQRCNIVRPCKTKRCTGHCKWPKRSKRGRPLGACRLGNCSRFNPGLAADVLSELEAERGEVASEE